MLKSILRVLRGLYQPSLVIVTSEKILEAENAYTALDVVSNSDTNGVGTAWEFNNVAKKAGGSGYITNAHVIAETTNIGGWFSLFLFTEKPTCELDDSTTNTAPLIADRNFYIGRIDFPACTDIGTGAQDSHATPSTVGNLPISFVCKPDSKNLYGVMAIRNAVDLADDTILTIKLTIEQY